MLTRADFGTAVKDALRHCLRADLLAGNALLQARLLTGSCSSAAAPAALRALIAETVKTLFANELDQRLYRVLDLTYFNPAPKQEAAAGQLGLSFSTYRRSLATGVHRLTEWLWQQEQTVREAEISPGQPAVPTTAPEEALRTARPRLSIVVLPFLNLSRRAGLDYLVDGIVP